MNDDGEREARLRAGCGLHDGDSGRLCAPRWIDVGVERLLAVWARCGERYARRLAEQHHPGDPVDDLLTLAARRVVPLPAPRRRGLPRDALSPAAVALCRLVRPDRRALLAALRGQDLGRRPLAGKGLQRTGARRETGPSARRTDRGELDDPVLDHATAAMWRLMEQVRAARRVHDAPPADPLPGE